MKTCVLSLLFIFVGIFGYGDEIPVIFIHKSDSYYLKDSLWQAKQYNNRVILIGDESNSHYDGVEHYRTEEYFSEAEDFAKIYQHQAVNPYNYELFCIQRWFVLKEFMEKNQIEKCFYCDSDIMLYCDVNEEYENFKDYEISLIHKNDYTPYGRKYCYSGHSSYFTLKGIQEVNKGIIEFYANFETNRHLYQHISDMYVLDFFVKNWKELGGKIGPMEAIIHNSRFEDHISVEGDQYVMDKRGLKEVTWFDNQPYCYHKKLKRHIRFNILHFQAGKKKLMKYYRREALASSDVSLFTLTSDL